MIGSLDFVATLNSTAAPVESVLSVKTRSTELVCLLTEAILPFGDILTSVAGPLSFVLRKNAH